MRIGEPLALSPEQARTIETLGDDGTPAAGFLRSTDLSANQYTLHVDPTQLTTQGEYYFAFRRFAQTLFQQPSTKNQPATDALRALVHKNDLPALEHNQAPAHWEVNARDATLPTLKVTTMNAEWFVTHWANPSNPEERLQGLADWINAQDADVIVLQELMNDWFERLQPLVPHMHGDAFAHRSSLPNSEVKIFSRHHIVQTMMYPQSWISSLALYCYIGESLGAQRGFGIAVIDFHGTDVAVATLHDTVAAAQAPEPENLHIPGHALQLQDADAISAERIMTYLDLWTYLSPYLDTHPVIVAGDFNVNPIHRELAVWQRLTGTRNALLESQNLGVTHYTRPNQGPTCDRPDAAETFSRCNRRAASHDDRNLGLLDHIFVNRHLLNLYTYIDKTTDTFSDHWAVTGRYRIRPNDRRITLASTRRPASPPPLAQDEIEQLSAYFRSVHVNLFCVQSGRVENLDQRAQTLALLDRIKALY